MKAEIRSILNQLTVEEKASLTSGAGMFVTQAIDHAGIPAVHLSDGPHGLRKQLEKQDFMGQNESIVATSFPAECATGSSFDPVLMEEIGRMLGRACQANDVQVLLGPGVNIKRSPLCGRNFEYFSEDPHVSGVMGSAYVRGVQSEGVGTSLKHFIANNQETRRRTQTSEMDERTMMEIYAPAFEHVIKTARPWTVMSSYNRFHGTYVNETPELCKDVLKKDWGFEGLVVSDWAAVHNRIAVIKGGCALTMPGDKVNDQVIVDAVRTGSLSEKELDEACADIIELALRVKQERQPDAVYDFEAAHALARRAEEESMVLLKNDDAILPLDPSRRIAIIGKFAVEPHFQGNGSSHINAWYVPSVLDAAKDAPHITFAEGFDFSGSIHEDKQNEAVEAAKAAEYAIVFAGVPAVMEGEGFDKWTMKLPVPQNTLIEKICAVQPNTIVVLQNGSAVEMPWVNRPKAILGAYLGGEAVSEAIWNVLTGAASPSGHLAESFPKRIEDTPAFLAWPGEGDRVEYPEGVFVGYRWYASRDMEVLFPFGHGLTYTSFSYSDLKIASSSFRSGDMLPVSVTVTNTGNRPGKALVQLYIGVDRINSAVRRPVRELRAFEKVLLQPGESKEISFSLDRRAFAYWDAQAHSFRVPGGDYTVEICENAQSVLLSAAVHVEEEYMPGFKLYSIMTPISDVQAHPAGKRFLEAVMPKINAMIERMNMGQQMAGSIPYAELQPKNVGLMSEPLQTLKRMLPTLPEEEWENLFRELNAS